MVSRDSECSSLLMLLLRKANREEIKNLPSDLMRVIDSDSSIAQNNSCQVLMEHRVSSIMEYRVSIGSLRIFNNNVWFVKTGFFQ
jgi:hypothetical protein